MFSKIFIVIFIFIAINASGNITATPMSYKNNICEMIVFSDRAYNAIIRESFDKDPDETGGILLGHILDNGIWIVMEVLPPGYNSTLKENYFEYDDAFVNYLAQSVANQYKIPLELLGLWHRHPGSMDVFSSTDDGTNTTFALQNPRGVISGLVNIDPQFRLTMYHMENPRNVVRQYTRPNYKRIDVVVGDDIIPENYFEYRYFNSIKK
ncbi:Mov34/MPN/PAD-1 family protein [Bacteroides thetaiotaomicron]|uniref:Mov34/MPN/PAD-1 family protein n=1 Tax=Bacteroides thetaiotaomicron TaxID=818 RepID=UPI0018AC1498|nr:Mov34/MPN/PAD-1 family protein [Bacteroides thetaiotaomicron]MDC2216142.1 Mov34/MPN/PAD-1 family protein [Bacteroides thetaiotaomicron]